MESLLALNPILARVQIIAGLVLLIKGADFIVIGASSIARQFDISELGIGLTIVAVGTAYISLAIWHS